VDLKQFEAAIEAAGDAGDLEAVAELGRAMKAQMQRANPNLGKPEAIPIGQEGMPDAIRSVVREQSRPAAAFAGAGSALALAAHGISGADSLNPDVQNWRALSRSTGDSIGGNLVGNMLLFGALPTRAAPAINTVTKLPAWALGRTAGAVDTAAVAGGTNYSLTPGSGGERTLEGVLSAGIAPVAPALYAAAAGGRRALTREGKQIAVGEGMLAEAGPNADNIITSLRGADPGASIGVRSSSAMKTQNPMIEAMESGARAKRGDLWRNFDKENAKSRWDALVAKAGTPEELAGMERNLHAKTGELREEALSDAQLTTIFSQSGDVTPPMLKSLREKVSDWRFSLRPNKEVQKLANYIESELQQGVTAEQLYEVRKSLTDGIKPGRNDELANAVKAARKQSVEAIKIIDDSLNTLSGGGWKEYLSKHSAGMRPIESKQALQDVVSSLERGMPTGLVPPAMGESPAWKTVGNLRDSLGSKDLGSKTVDTLLPEDRQLLDTIVDSLKRQADGMQAKGVLGSQTGALLANMGRADGVTRNIVEGGMNRVVPFSSILSSKVFDSLGRKAEEELAMLLQNPEALAEALASAIRARQVQAGASKVGAAAGGAFSSQ
jgi:hypothetical protein